MNTEISQHIKESARIIKERSNGLAPKIAVVLGSGLGDYAENLSNTVTINYQDLPGFPIPSVAGHAGEVVLGQVGGTDVLCLRGRVHLYEGNDFSPLKVMIRTLKELGIESIFSTSACGSLRTEMTPGEIMMITDHINMMGVNPLIGHNEDDYGPRFPAMSDAWDSNLRAQLFASSKALDIKLHDGVFLAFRGPTFETPAEVRMAQGFGGDAVGMSSVPECIVARHCGIKMVGCAVITNLAAGLSDENLSHEHTLANATLAADKLKTLLTHFLENLNLQSEAA